MSKIEKIGLIIDYLLWAYVFYLISDKLILS